jgi:hypothetical protein
VVRFTLCFLSWNLFFDPSGAADFSDMIFFKAFGARASQASL